MLFGDIYRDFIVRKAEIEESQRGRAFVCELEGWDGHKVGFSLTIQGCVGEGSYQTQYNAIAPFFKVGAILHCSIVYRLRADSFVMCIDEVMPMNPICHHTGKKISVDSYFNRNRGFWTRLISAGDWVKIPGVIEFSGRSHIPLVEDGSLPLKEYSHHYDEGLQYGKRPTLLKRVLKLVFV